MADAAAWWPAPAKINLFLRVLGRRDDGYHELQTLFQLLNWGDEIRIQPVDDGSIRRGQTNYRLHPDQDLVVSAARLLQQVSHCRQGALIDVRKHIPMGAGLGGGSSNAATVLLVLNRLWQTSLDTEELALLGGELGADVPVFVRGRSSLATGIGEKLTPFALGNRDYLLVMPDIKINTADVFNDPALPRNSRPLNDHELQALADGNDCEAVVFKQFPEMLKIKQHLANYGSPRMSGTGSSFFLQMNDKNSAKEAAEALKSHYNVRAVGGEDVSSLHARLETAEN